eukprot:CAMPEP_0116140488 /NCGR_PEP_ID=MMETSP0329-20121206/13877_1 /TAXON_ID=697910 /ORGANISM="Pseudo-nitzschia arenysensis, Strain B593" /LENGTH=341 /DNA_ID=CAMNT_0003635611 /DNA_START=294 /DNA_END=1319 /DNA_ORIENTATION=-
MSNEHQDIVLVSTSSCDSAVSGLSQTMGIPITCSPTRKVSLEDRGDDASRMDCCDTTASSVSMSDHEPASSPPSTVAKNKNKDYNDNENNENNENNATRTCSHERSSCRRRLFQKQSSWNSTRDSSKPKKSPKHFRLGSHLNRLSKHNDAPSVTDSSTSTAAAAGELHSQTNKTLFQDDMDIVAFQEWPPQRRQPYQRRYRYHRNYDSNNNSNSNSSSNNNFHHQYPLHMSPSSVCATFSVETIATKLGRSPVVVSFDDVDLIHPHAPLAPISIAGRIPTGRFPGNNDPNSFSESDQEDSCRSNSNSNNNGRTRTGCSDLVAESFFKAIRSTLFCGTKPQH